jgi:hypothetical protein
MRFEWNLIRRRSHTRATARLCESIFGSVKKATSFEIIVISIGVVWVLLRAPSAVMASTVFQVYECVTLKTQVGGDE